MEDEVGHLLYELCVQLGFCLSPEAQQRLVQSPLGSVDAFTDAVFEAEGLGDMSYTDLREKVRELVATHMGRWAEA
ncbi:hypothetical protein OWR29_42395 [Actinoplanes sp. Pm04-4]|uniref:Uncharacterized protein n=1 Tax=Paractinoplanes pyxinae TaxID=2997416 RepID=A0ABT4BE11_9ACTN|nr:hypothetical protein [Actinoplanes pyxinae]MCY1144691.1 hypothetical protein [Actinoplanes pyxinae]